MKKFIKLLQNAHSGELAAYYAYEGHWKSVSDLSERIKIQLIQIDELKHQVCISIMLMELGAKPNKVRDFVFSTIGKTLSVLCRVTGWFLPMWGALFIEKIGIINYEELAKEAEKENKPTYAVILREMGEVEKQHANYFIGRLKSDRVPSEESDPRNQS